MLLLGAFLYGFGNWRGMKQDLRLHILKKTDSYLLDRLDFLLRALSHQRNRVGQRNFRPCPMLPSRGTMHHTQCTVVKFENIFIGTAGSAKENRRILWCISMQLFLPTLPFSWMKFTRSLRVCEVSTFQSPSFSALWPASISPTSKSQRRQQNAMQSCAKYGRR